MPRVLCLLSWVLCQHPPRQAPGRNPPQGLHHQGFRAQGFKLDLAKKNLWQMEGSRRQMGLSLLPAVWRMWRPSIHTH